MTRRAAPAVVVTVAVVLLLAAGIGALNLIQAGAPSPSASEMDSPSPSATPDAVATTAHPIRALAPNGLAEVVTEDLVVRSLPEISATSTIAPTALSTGKLLFVLDGPVAADGYEWYQVAPFDEFISDIASEAPRLGWVAAGRSAEAWIAPWTGDCPAPSLEEIWSRSPFLRLACFRDDAITLQGMLGDCGDVHPGIVEPMWLANHHCWLLRLGGADELSRDLIVRQESEILDSLGKGVALRVIGHFDHPAAQTCVEFTLPGEEPTPPELLVLQCRAEFVATDVTVISAPRLSLGIVSGRAAPS